MISEATFNTVMKHEDLLNSAVLYDRDFSYVCKNSQKDSMRVLNLSAELLWLQDP